MSLRDIERAAVFGALHEDLIADGEPFDAWLLRAIGRSANALVTWGEPFFRYIFDARLDAGDETNGATMGFAFPAWQQILPGPITRPKKPGLTSALVDVLVKIGSDPAHAGDVVELAIETEAIRDPTNATGIDAHVLTMTSDGSGSWQSYTKTGIPIDPGIFERVSVFIRGKPTTRLANTGTYGGVNSGTINTCFPFGEDATKIGVSGVTWRTTSPTLADGGHAIIIRDAASKVPIMDPMAIIAVLSGSELLVWPGPQDLQAAAAAIGATFEIVEVPTWRFADVAGHTEDRTA